VKFGKWQSTLEHVIAGPDQTYASNKR